MNLSEVRLFTFSPTHTSKRVGQEIMKGLDIKKQTTVDLTVKEYQDYDVAQDALAIFTVPVYGGHVAPLALKRLSCLKGCQTPAVIVVVYGNRAYEQSLKQLDNFVTERGFKVIAGGTFVGEHSYSLPDFPIAAGRPNSDDLLFARHFGEEIQAKITGAADADHLYGVEVLNIKRPSQPFFSLLHFAYQITKWKKSNTPLPRAPKTDEQLCTHCGTCVDLCPAGAIVLGDELNTLADKCIKCCACVKGCPQGARTYDTPFTQLLARNFQKQKKNCTIL